MASEAGAGLQELWLRGSGFRRPDTRGQLRSLHAFMADRLATAFLISRTISVPSLVMNWKIPSPVTQRLVRKEVRERGDAGIVADIPTDFDREDDAARLLACLRDRKGSRTVEAVLTNHGDRPVKEAVVVADVADADVQAEDAELQVPPETELIRGLRREDRDGEPRDHLSCCRRSIMQTM